MPWLNACRILMGMVAIKGDCIIALHVGSAQTEFINKLKWYSTESKYQKTQIAF
jgi:hypothetical protein